MASQSLTAVASVVSVMKEKTVIALRINTRGCERVFYPMLIIVLCCLCIACLAVAAGTPAWAEVNALQDSDDDGVLEDRGSSTFGLFRGSYSIALITPTPFSGSYDIRDRFTTRDYNVSTIPLSRIYATFAFDIIAIALCVVTIPLTLLNSYQTVTTWWKGPPMMYMFALFTSLTGFIALGIFSDFFIWQLVGTAVLVRSTEFTHLLDGPRPYSTTESVGYSFWLLLVGAIIPLFSTLLSWRLAVLVHPRRPQDNTTLSASPSGLQMGEVPSLAGLGSSKLSGSAINYERGGPVLY